MTPEELVYSDGGCIVHVERQQGSANGNHNIVNNGLPEVEALKAHIRSLEEEIRFQRQQVKSLTNQLSTALLQIQQVDRK